MENETHPRPVDAIATIEYTPETLTVIVPSEISRKSPAVQRLFVAFQMGFCLFICGFVGWLLYGFSHACRLFWDVFDFWPALGCSALVLGIAISHLYILLLPLYAMCDWFAHWRLVISQTEVRFECRVLFWTQKIHVVRHEGLTAEQGIHRYFTRQQLTLRYWIDCNPAWGPRHIRLNTAPPIVFRYTKENERDWLLQVINDFLQPDNS